MRLAIVVLAALSLGCASFFAGVDDTCIAGKLTPAGAKLLNETPGSVKWHQDYVDRLGLSSENDRILGAHCSELVKAVSGAISN